MRDLQWRHFSPRNIVREQTIKQFLAYNHWLLRRLFQSFSSRISDKDIIRYGLNDGKCPSLHEPLTTLHSNIVVRVGDSSFQLLCPIVGRSFADCLSFRLIYHSCLLTYLPINDTFTQATCCCNSSLKPPLSDWGVSTDWITGVDVSSWTARVICSAHSHDISSNVIGLAMTTTSFSSKPFTKRSSDSLLTCSL